MPTDPRDRRFGQERREPETELPPCTVACKDFSCCLKHELCNTQCKKVDICGLCEKLITCEPEKKSAVQGYAPKAANLARLVSAYTTEVMLIPRLKTDVDKVPGWNIIARRNLNDMIDQSERKVRIFKEIFTLINIDIPEVKK